MADILDLEIQQEDNAFCVNGDRKFAPFTLTLRLMQYSGLFCRLVGIERLKEKVRTRRGRGFAEAAARDLGGTYERLHFAGSDQYEVPAQRCKMRTDK